MSPAFRRLWASDALSVSGSEITAVALPLAAVLLLDAGPREMGALVACELLPYALLSLPAGTWVDRWPKRPLLVGAAWARCALLLAVPLAAAAGALNIELLCALAFALATLAVLADLAYQALLPQLVPREVLVESNARLGITQSAAGIVGPGAAGLLVQAVGAPVALLADAAAVAASGVLLRGLPDAARDAPRERAPWWREMTAGLVVLRDTPVLRRAALAGGAWQFLKQGFQALVLLFAVRELGLQAAQVGWIVAMAGVGFGLASASLPAVTRRIGLEGAVAAGFAVVAACWAGVPALGGDRAGWGLALLTLGEGVGAGWLCLAIVSLRQVVAPPDCLARVAAAFRTLTAAAAPLGALAAGALAQSAGLRPALIGIGVAGLAAVLLTGLAARRAAAYCTDAGG